MDFISTSYVAFFLIVAIGIVIGNIKIKGISLDISAIIFVALIFGHYGIQLPKIFQEIGLILFMFSVGIQAGPGFFDSFRKKGAQLITLAVLVSVSGAITAIVLGYAFDVDFHIAVGLFTGALTSTSGLAAAIESTNSPMASIGFGIAYPFGVLGVILFARLSNKLFRVSIKEEEQKYLDEVHEDHPFLQYKNFIVENENACDIPLKELKLPDISHTNISKIYHRGQLVLPTANAVLKKGDLVRACGTEEDLKKLNFILGNETDQSIPESTKFSVRKFLVTNKQVLGITLGHLRQLHSQQATITSIRRSGIDIMPSANTKLRFGDKITVIYPEENQKKIGEVVGDSRKKLDELNFLPIALGILIGILVGKLRIPLWGDYSFSLGMTGGILITAIILSKIGKTGNIVWNISGTINMFLRKLGLIFFLAAVGTNAGEQLVSTIQENGLELFLLGAIITIIPMLMTVIIGHYVLKINFLTLIGALTGSMTSTPALTAVEPMTDTNAPQVAYATVYPFALVMLIIVSQIIGNL